MNGTACGAIAMHERACEKCRYGELMKPGTYKMGNMTMNITGTSWKCKRKTVRMMTKKDGEMYCSDFEEKEE